MGPIRSRCGPVQPLVDVVQFLAEVASHVKPPVAHEHGLTELRSVRAQERRLPAVDVTVVPCLAPGVHVREEAWVRLVVAIEVCVWYHGQYRVVRAWFACNGSEMLAYMFGFFSFQLLYNQSPTVNYI